MKTNDVIVAIGGHDGERPAGRRRREIRRYEPGDKVDVPIERDGASRSRSR